MAPLKGDDLHQSEIWCIITQYQIYHSTPLSTSLTWLTALSWHPPPLSHTLIQACIPPTYTYMSSKRDLLYHQKRPGYHSTALSATFSRPISGPNGGFAPPSAPRPPPPPLAPAPAPAPAQIYILYYMILYCVCVCACVYVYTYVCMYIHTQHTHTHTHKYIPPALSSESGATVAVVPSG